MTACLLLAYIPETMAFLTNHHKSNGLSLPGSFQRPLNCADVSRKLRDSDLPMTLIPLEREDLSRLIAVGAPTGIQYSTYWGRTQQEQYGRAVESALVSILGMFFSYFMSFVVGSFVATIFGALFLFWGILSPELKAYQRNWEFLGGRELVDLESLSPSQDPDRAGLYGALFLGYIRDVCVVEDTSDDSIEYRLDDFSDYDVNDDELERFKGQPYLLRIHAMDSTGRELQVHARLMTEYLSLEPGMPVAGIMLATTPRFDRLAAITDLLVTETMCYVGDYPYLDRAELEELLATDDEVWERLQSEGGFHREESLELPEEGGLNREGTKRNTPDSDSTKQ